MKPCPQCGTRGSVSVSMKLVALPLGTWSLSGGQMKANCVVKACLECSECGLQVYGRIEGAEMAGGSFVGGHFVADRTPVMTP